MSESVSIIIPVYNAAKTLNRCIESVLRQEYDDFEAIFINDGSRDNSGEILEDFAQKDKRIKIITQSNAGVSLARNAGLDEASGSYICFLDSDDYIESEYISKLTETIQFEDSDLAQCGYYELSPFVKKPIVLHDFQKFYAEKVISQKQFQANLFNGLTGVLWGKMFKKEIIDALNLRLNPEISYSEDLIFVLRYSNEIKNIGIVYDNLYHYDRTNENGLSSKIDEVFLKNLQLSNEEIEKYYIGEDKNNITQNRFRVGILNLIDNTAGGDLALSTKKNKIKSLWYKYQSLFLDSFETKTPTVEALQKGKLNQMIFIAVLKRKYREIKKQLK